MKTESKVKQALGYMVNFIFELPINKFRPIVIVGDVGTTHARLFVSYMNCDINNVCVVGSYITQKQKLIMDDSCKYSAYSILISNLTPDTKYDIPVHVNNTLTHVEFKTHFDLKQDISFLVGSCNLHTLNILKSSDQTFDTLESLRKDHSVDFMLHLGDQIYSDIPFPFFHPTLNYYCAKYFNAWSGCEPANTFLRKLSNYMTLDDHEIINNYRNRSDREKYIDGLKAYEIFQLSHSPRKPNEYHYTFKHGKHNFFVLDCRTTRSADSIICQNQEAALYTWLLEHKDEKTFKFIASSIPFLVDMDNAEGDKWCTGKFSHQRNRIIEFITNNKIDNVVFLTGDVHCSLLTTGSFTSKELSADATIHEITSSPLNQVQFSKINTFNRSHTIDTKVVSGRVSTYKYYDDSSNVALVKVCGNKLSIDFYRTSTKEKVQSATINLKV